MYSIVILELVKLSCVIKFNLKMCYFGKEIGEG